MNKEQRSIWRKNNPDKHREEQRVHYRRHKEEVAKRVRDYKEEHPYNFSRYQAARATRKTKSGGSYTSEEWFTLCFAVGFRCLCCGEIKKLTADHVVPISKGGTSWLYNIQPLCLSCNASKGNHHCVDYRY